MPQFNPADPLAIPQLFQHQFDIDDLILALCGPFPQWLNSTNGQLSATQPAAPASHRFMLEPLPASFIGSLAHTPELRTLSPADRAAVQALLPTLSLATLPAQFGNGSRVGGWLRERVKEAALEWLDAHN
ncbi:MAG: hypothetical protein INF43_01145, partial [Alphaproteobacteria bacterium]|nr:hypothetical protein [Alphaproteobacteria bacterium]